MAILIPGIPYTEKKPGVTHPCTGHQVKQLERLTQDGGIQMKTLEIKTRKMTTRGPQKENKPSPYPTLGLMTKAKEAPFTAGAISLKKRKCTAE